MASKRPEIGVKYKEIEYELTQPPAHPTADSRARPTIRGRSQFTNALCATEPTGDGRSAQ